MPNESNPYESSATMLHYKNHGSGSLVRFLLRSLIAYYVVSVLTLQFANEIWVGEIPLLGLPQIPKSMCYSAVREQLVDVMHMLGISRGSASPNMMAASPWAFGIVFVAPFLVALGVIACLRRIIEFRGELIWLAVIASLDAVGTLHFEATHGLTFF